MAQYENYSLDGTGLNETTAFARGRVSFADGTTAPRIGQGSRGLGQDPLRRSEEVAALRLGVELGMDLIDTGEMYGLGRAEEVVGEAVAGIRDRVFLVSHVRPGQPGAGDVIRGCEESLRRLGTDRLDLCLLHRPGNGRLEETVEGLHRLVEQGKIGRWGVSNFGAEDMRELSDIGADQSCAANQVLYHLGSRGIERELLPWQKARRMPLIAHSPLAQAGQLRKGMTDHLTVRRIAAAHGVEPLQVLLAWIIQGEDIIAIPKAASAAHVRANAAAAHMKLDGEQMRMLDDAFPPPAWRVPLDRLSPAYL